MSLDFSVERMKNYDVLTTLVVPEFKSADGTKTYAEQRKWHPVTDALIWATMPLGMNQITDKNWIDFYHRLHMYERLTGTYLRRSDNSNDDKNYITPLEVFMHIGLSTNASNKTRKQFEADCLFAFHKNLLNDITKAPEKYAELKLDEITEEEFQKAMRVKEFNQSDSVEAMVERTRKGWTPELEDGYLLGTTENIGSTTDN